MPRLHIALSAALLGALSACGPMSPEAAARYCEERAQKAQSPFSGTIGIGVNQDGPVTNTDLTVGITDDYIRGADPDFVYERCVRQRTGQGPIRPPDLR